MGRCHSRCSDLFKNGETWKNSLRDFIPNAEGYLWGSRWRGQELIALLLVVFEGQRKINILCNRTDARGSRKEPLSGRFRFQKCLHLSSATPEVDLQRRRLTHTITVFMLDYSYLHRVPPRPHYPPKTHRNKFLPRPVVFFYCNSFIRRCIRDKSRFMGR